MKSFSIFRIPVVLTLLISNVALASAAPVNQNPSEGKVDNNAGIGAGLQPIPDRPGKSASIRLHHLRQEPYLCVTTSATMVLAYYGVKTSPRELKALSDGRAYNPNQTFHYNKFTYFPQLVKGVASLGCAWRFVSFPLTGEGFRTGLAHVKAALDRGNPPLVDTGFYGDHTFVICGYDEATASLLIMDPNIPHPGLRALSYAQFERVWNSDGVNCHYRAAVFTTGKPGKMKAAFAAAARAE